MSTLCQLSTLGIEGFGTAPASPALLLTLPDEGAEAAGAEQVTEPG